jgi:hypothetical protein
LSAGREKKRNKGATPSHLISSRRRKKIKVYTRDIQQQKDEELKSSISEYLISSRMGTGKFLGSKSSRSRKIEEEQKNNISTPNLQQGEERKE